GDPERPTKIHEFVEKSPDVEVVLNAKALPFIQEGLDPGVADLLLCGFFAGNASAQLRAGVKRDDMHAGVDGELKIYRALKLRANDPPLKGLRLNSPGLNALLEMETDGKLRAYLDQVLAERKVVRPTQ